MKLEVCANEKCTRSNDATRSDPAKLATRATRL
jgi:hypothetical protein